MKIVILAAGAGKRLKSLSLPKPLTPLADGSTILGRQLKLLNTYAPQATILIVVGYHKEKIMEQFPDLLFVYNPDYTQENTAKSLLRALKHINNEDLLWINGDVVFRPSALEAFLAEPKTSMLVNEAPVGDEEVKYRTDSKGKILEVSKTVEDPVGEALGINFFKANDLETLKYALMQCQNNDYFEKAIELCITAGRDVWSVPVDAHDCVEIDFPEDLKRANQIL